MLRRIAVTAVVVAFAGLPVAASEPRPASGHLAASAEAELIRAEALTPAVFRMADASVAATSAEVASYALDRSTAVSRARASNADATLFGSTSRSGPSVAAQSASPDNAQPTVVRAAAIEPGQTGGAVALGAGTASAHARSIDVGAGACPEASAGGTRTLSSSSAGLASASVLPGADAVRATGIATSSTVDLVPSAGSGLAVRATATASASSIVLGGVYEIRIAGSARLTVRASGTPGGASVDYEHPVVDVVDLRSGERVAALGPDLVELGLPGDPVLGSFVSLRLGSPRVSDLLDDGTFARAEVALLEVWFTDFAGAYEQGDVRIAPLSASATAPPGGVTACDGGARAERDGRPHVVVYSGWRTFHHLSTDPGVSVLSRIANARGDFTVEFTSNANFLRPEKLRETDVIVWNNTAGNVPWSEAQRRLYEDWARCGGATVGIHSAADANYDWPAYKDILGAQFQSHPHVGYWPEAGAATVQVEDRTHPATAPWHALDRFDLPDEYYLFRDDPRARVHVLLSLDETSTYPWTRRDTNPAGNPLIVPFGGQYPDDQPLAWTKTYGAGRTFYTNLGHNAFTWARDDFQTHLVNGLLWAASVRPDLACAGLS